MLLRNDTFYVVFVIFVVGNQPVVDVLFLDEYAFLWFMSQVDSCLLSDHVHAI